MAHLIGSKRDQRNRIDLARVDDHKRRLTVARVRQLIYQQNYAIDSAGVEQILQPESLIPTSVRQCNSPSHIFH
jgi:hypothetical protein